MRPYSFWKSATKRLFSAFSMSWAQCDELNIPIIGAPTALISAPAKAGPATSAPEDASASIPFRYHFTASECIPFSRKQSPSIEQQSGMALSDTKGISIPVGKDSMSMKTTWKEGVTDKAVTAPLSLIVSAFAPCPDVRFTLTPQLATELDSALLLIDLGAGKNRMGGSALAQAFNQTGDIVPDVDDAEALKAFFNMVQRLNSDGLLLAYHDRSDGGLLATLCEMAFASHMGLDITLDKLGDNAISALFNEELGAVIQVRRSDLEILNSSGNSTMRGSGHHHRIGSPSLNHGKMPLR